MSIPIDGTYSVPVSGPSPRLAMLRALYLKARGISRNTLAHARTTLSLAGQMPQQWRPRCPASCPPRPGTPP